MTDQNHPTGVAQAVPDREAITRIIKGIYGLGCGTYAGGHQNKSIARAVDAIVKLVAARPPAAPVETEEWEEVTDGTTQPGDRFSYIPNAETGVGQITSHKRRVQRSSAETEGLKERVAIYLWHRFAPEGHMEWSEETHQAEYRDAAEGALILAGIWPKPAETKEVDTFQSDKCPTCLGDGYINTHANLPDTKCLNCNGTGFVDWAGERK